MIIDRKLSVHLQDFPDVNFLEDETDLVANMDLVRAVCSVALSIRDNKNLRVRLPLKSLTIIGKNTTNLNVFKEIIAEEVNVKDIILKEQIEEFAETKLIINFKKIGAKYGAKIKEITQAVKENKWQKISDKKIEIANLLLVDDEFEFKLDIKNNSQKDIAIAVLPTNDYLVILDINVTKDLENEGIARDIVRAIQQNRKEANLNISDFINIKISSDNSRIIEVVKFFEEYIKDQVLAKSIATLTDFVNFESKLIFESQLDNGLIRVAIEKH